MVKKAGARQAASRWARGPKTRANRAPAEAGNLLFPLRLERGWADDEHPFNALASRQQLAGCDGLDRLAEPHVVGKERPLAEGQVQRAKALIWQQRMLEHIDRVAAGGQIGFKIARAPPGACAARRARSSHGPKCRDRRIAEDTGPGARGQAARSASIGSGSGVSVPSFWSQGWSHSRTGANAASPAVDGQTMVGVPATRRSGNTSIRGLPTFAAARQSARFAALQSRQNALDMLAGAQTVHSVIDATTGIGEPVEVSDFHVVTAAARRARPEDAKETLIGLDRRDVENFRPPAPAAQCDLVLIAGSPAQDRCAFEDGFCLACPNRLPQVVWGGLPMGERALRHLWSTSS